MLQLNSQHYDEIVKHGQPDYSHEFCGLLMGRFTEEGKVVAET